jgi:hypothetical protein
MRQINTTTLTIKSSVGEIPTKNTEEAISITKTKASRLSDMLARR